MRLLKGVITDKKPIVKAEINEAGALVFSDHGPFEFVIDTGFTGDVFIPEKLVGRLNLDLLSYETFELGADLLIELPVYRGVLVIGKTMVEAEMVPGDALVGMGLMQAIGSKLSLDFEKAEVVLSG